MTDALKATAGPVERPELQPLPNLPSNGVQWLLGDEWKVRVFYDYKTADDLARDIGQTSPVRRFTIHEAAAPEPGSAGWAVPNRQAEDDRSQFDKAAEKLREAFDEKDRPVLSDPVVRPANDVAPDPEEEREKCEGGCDPLTHPVVGHDTGGVPLCLGCYVELYHSTGGAKGAVPVEAIRYAADLAKTYGEKGKVTQVFSLHGARSVAQEIHDWLSTQPAPAPERRFTDEELEVIEEAARWLDELPAGIFHNESRRSVRGLSVDLRRMVEEAK